MNDREEERATEIACRFWNHIANQDWAAVRESLTDEFEAYWPQSKEKIVGPDNFVEINRNYPGKGNIQVENWRWGYDRWEHISEVTTTTRISWERPDGKTEELFAISLFEINWKGKIQSAVEYWAETYPAPEWRQKWVGIDPAPATKGQGSNG